MLTDELKQIIENDIKLCEEQQSTKNGSEKLLEGLIAKYSTIYDGFKDEIPINGKIASVGSEFDYRREINSLAEKLKMISATGILKERTSPSINISNNNSNQMIVNISFEEAKRKIEEMTALSEKDTKEAIDKIHEIKSIVESDEPKKSKWQKVKPVLLWLADKSVDVGIALLPLLMKIGG